MCEDVCSEEGPKSDAYLSGSVGKSVNVAGGPVMQGRKAEQGVLVERSAGLILLC